MLFYHKAYLYYFFSSLFYPPFKRKPCQGKLITKIVYSSLKNNQDKPDKRKKAASQMDVALVFSKDCC